ncbi:MerR family transcriptional regulator [Nonomuraea angiospora]|uniref:MerR family transcriptional regulator n=1 Tax=Nonomuraea angiospora TaxID=46172 RepID=UPI003428F824
MSDSIESLVSLDMCASMRLNVDMKSSATMSIGEIAERFGLATHVLRHWEAMGLITPIRVEGARRRYGPDDLYRVAVILRGKEAGFSLEEIHEMMTTSDAGQRRAVLLRRREELARRIAEAQASLELIDCALDCDHEDLAACAHFQSVVAERVLVAVRSP